MRNFLRIPLALLCLAAALAACSCALGEVEISEILTDNGVFNTEGQAYDWIELHNTGKKPVDLSGWGLTDTKEDPYAYTFPAGSKLAANGYCLIRCDGGDGNISRPKAGNYFAPFKLSDSGETLRLTDPEGNEVVKLKYPEQFPGYSWGRAEGSEEYGFFAEATPKKKNAPRVYTALSDRPVFTQAAGFYPGAVSVEIRSDDPVYYTTDGSEPTAASKKYTGAFTVSKTAVVRAKAIPRDKLPSYTATATYIVNDPAITPVISFTTDRSNMYGSKGLFIHPNYNTAQEYPMNFEYFDENGVQQLNQSGSFRIVGTSTRGQKQKSLAVYARTAYGGTNRFNYNPFDDREYESYRAFTIRSTGSDAVYCRMRDLVLTRLAAGLDIMYLAGKTVIVYINGEYAGQYNLREKSNKYSVAQWEGVTDKAVIDKIDIIEGESRPDQVHNGSADDWLELRAFVKSHDLKEPENLKYVTDRLDVDSLFTWTSFQLIILNADLENVRVYRIPGGKWKYMLYDVEDGGSSNPAALYKLLDKSRNQGALSSQYSLINRLLLVPEMRARFLQRLAEVTENSFLFSERVKPEIDRNEALLARLLPRHFTIYKNTNMSEWRINVSAFRKTMRTNPRYVLKMVKDTLKVTPGEQAAYFDAVEEKLSIYNAKETLNN